MHACTHGAKPVIGKLKSGYNEIVFAQHCVQNRASASYVGVFLVNFSEIAPESIIFCNFFVLSRSNFGAARQLYLLAFSSVLSYFY